MKENDFVTILSENPRSPNREARVDKVCEDGVYVSNLNMPFMGTFSYKFFKNNEVEKLETM